ERRLTDLAHLMELLHTQALYTRQGSFALASWYERMREDSRLRVGMASQSAQIRLESDAHAVTLTTIHKSKGLDYPIVYCPFLWDGKLLRGDKYLDFHDLDHDNRRSLDHVKDNPAWDRHKQWAETEALAEHLRLVYVALTRAKHRVSVVWGGINESHSSALAYLLHQPPGAPALGLAAATAARTDGLSDAAMISDLAALAEAAEGCIGVRLLEGGEDPGSYEHREGDIELHEPVLPKLARDIVRASSFSRLATKTKQPLASSVDDAHDLDAADEGLPAPTGEGGDAAAAPELAAQGPRIALAEFPTGAVRGQAIHTIYENIDFRETDPAALLPHVEGALASYGMDTRAAPELGNALAATLLTPIDAEGLPNLACLAPEHRLAELEFVFPVAYAGERAARDAPLRPSTLARVLAAHATSDAEREYADKVAKLEFSSLHGYLRGFIDLVARHDGRYYVLDYKSNHLGKHAGDYAHAPMQAAMFEHHYVLQYLFYVVAVHRHLAQRLPDYDYDRHFGAVYYLFVRGMAPNHAPGSGVYRARPSRALIDDLSRALQSPGGAT
ncbi:MAG TPA: 3'-5' exonuclease, partial [Polyangiales bacterium]|nr:3'-5' exonuclease [Polyangiales bacterium]